jgi:putative copper resistance protein D
MSAIPAGAAAPTLGRLLGSWSLAPPIALALAAMAVLYLAAARRRSGWPAWRTVSFLAGLCLLAVALMSGIDDYAERLLSVHMVQHLLVALAAPALLLAGAPVRLALGSRSRTVRRMLATVLSSRGIRALGRPATGLALFATVMLATHLTGLFQLALEHPVVHDLEHGAYFLSGVVLLAPLIAVDPLPHRPGALGRFCWLMGGMTAMALPGALLAFSQSVRYPHYLATTRALGRSALTDQQLGGAVMWVGGGLALFALALILTLAAMVAEERRQQRRELHLAARGTVGPTDSTGAVGA